MDRLLDTKFHKFSDKDWKWIMDVQNFFRIWIRSQKINIRSPLVHIALELQYSYPYPVSKSFPDFFLSVGKRVPYSSPAASRPF